MIRPARSNSSYNDGARLGRQDRQLQGVDVGLLQELQCPLEDGRVVAVEADDDARLHADALRANRRDPPRVAARSLKPLSTASRFSWLIVSTPTNRPRQPAARARASSSGSSAIFSEHWLIQRFFIGAMARKSRLAYSGSAMMLSLTNMKFRGIGLQFFEHVRQRPAAVRAAGKGRHRAELAPVAAAPPGLHGVGRHVMAAGARPSGRGGERARPQGPAAPRRGRTGPAGRAGCLRGPAAKALPPRRSQRRRNVPPLLPGGRWDESRRRRRSCRGGGTRRRFHTPAAQAPS